MCIRQAAWPLPWRDPSRSRQSETATATLCGLFSGVKASRPKCWPLPRPRAFGLRLGSVLLTWPRKMCYPMQNNIGCIHFVVVVASFSLHESFGRLLRRFGTPTVSDSSKDLGFDDKLFPTASSLDPTCGHPASDDPTYTFQLLNDYLVS